jgi:ribosome-associated toxin RatA of RatAB toxin-antitoxin module
MARSERQSRERTQGLFRRILGRAIAPAALVLAAWPVAASDAPTVAPDASGGPRFESASSGVLGADERHQLARGDVVFGPAREREGFAGAIVVDAAPEHAWDVLTDFEAWPRFVPHIDAVSVRAEADGLRIRQTLKLFMQTFEYTVVGAVSSAAGRIELDLDRSAPSDFDRLEASFDVTELRDGRTLVRFHSDLEAGVALPAWVKRAIARSTVPGTLVAIRSEIERRARQARREVRTAANVDY